MTGKKFETLRYEVDGGLARLTLNRPDAMNGMTNQMVREATEALQLAGSDPSVRVLVLTGAGGAFCPGADLKHFTQVAPMTPNSLPNTSRSPRSFMTFQSSPSLPSTERVRARGWDGRWPATCV